jgi:hypothetical protein
LAGADATGSAPAATAAAAASASVAPAPSAPAPAFRAFTGDLTLAQRVDYVLGDPTRPFVDADAYRAQLGLKLSASGDCALLGVDDYVIDRAVTEAGDALMVTLPSGAQPCADRGFNRNASQVVLHAGLPLAAHAYAGLRRLAGHLTVIWADQRAVSWTVALARLKGAVVAIPGHPELTLTLGEARANIPETVFVASPAASLAVIELRPRGSDGQVINAPGQRSERREARQPRPGGGGDSVLVFPRVLPADATIEVYYQPSPRRSRVDFDLAGIAFGAALPALPAIRGSLAHGADEL